MLPNPHLTPAQQRTLAPWFAGSTAAAQSVIGFARPFFVRTREWREAVGSLTPSRSAQSKPLSEAQPSPPGRSQSPCPGGRRRPKFNRCCKSTR